MASLTQPIAWCVVLDTRGPDGEPYTNVYHHVVGMNGPLLTSDAAIDYVLEHYAGVNGGRNVFINGWRVVSAWAVRESVIGEVIEIVPIDQPVYKRAPTRTR